MSRPSDRAIAHAFLEYAEATVAMPRGDEDRQRGSSVYNWRRGVEAEVLRRAFEIDAAAPEGAQEVAVVVSNAVGVEIVWANPPSHGRPPVGTKLYSAPPSQDDEDAAIARDDAWALAEKVRTDLDRLACPDAFLRVAVESIVSNYAARAAERDGHD
ncbi:hypothetical protein [Lysobacter antibioticus]|uniref:hypothetical protein n=1 Tax=Lysobacter antibioticus TaxID=84531 RepID=UPI000716737E|nr:hypothetical protein [Lysobacter antibioticus]